MEKQEYLSQSKYADHRSVTKGYIGRLAKEGRLHLIRLTLRENLYASIESEVKRSTCNC